MHSKPKAQATGEKNACTNARREKFELRKIAQPPISPDPFLSFFKGFRLRVVLKTCHLKLFESVNKTRIRPDIYGIGSNQQKSDPRQNSRVCIWWLNFSGFIYGNTLLPEVFSVFFFFFSLTQKEKASETRVMRENLKMYKIKNESEKIKSKYKIKMNFRASSELVKGAE